MNSLAGESPTGRNQPRFIGTSGSCRRSDPLNRIHQTAEDLQGPGLTAELTGVPVMQLEIRQAVELDRILYNPVGFALGCVIAAPPPEATAPAIRHDSTRKASR